MGLTRDLDSGHVVQVGVCHGQLVTLVFETGRLSIIQNDNSVSIAGIVQITCRTYSVHDQIIILTAAGDKGINSGDIVSCHSQLGALPLLHRHHGPHVVHQRGNGDGNLNGDKHPGSLVRLPRCVLGPDNTCNSQSEVCHVQTRVGKSKQGHQLEDPSLPPLPDIGIIALVNRLNSAGVDDVLLGERVVAAVLGRTVWQ